jgi:CelD/BcsL family acetyltransferase involved in cellulose biosynthesis
MRYNVGYYTRRLFKLYDCKFRSIDRLEDLDPVIEAFVELHQARWQSKGQSGSFALPSFEAFLRNAVYSSCIEGRVKLWALDLTGRVAAVLLAFQDNGVAHYFQGGFDPAYARHSLGTVMCGLCIRACIESKDVNEFDFMGGDPSYKERWTQSSCDSVVLEWLPRNVGSQLVRISEVGESAGRSFLRLVTPDVLKQKIQSIRRKRLHPRKNP